MTPRSVVLLGDCIERLRELDADSVDAIVTDPPYGLEFMGKAWDGFDTAHAFGEWCRQWAVEALRVLKPGGHLLAFGGTRTYHRLVCGVEDAGFEVRDTIAWLYGSGFPKSLDVSKAIDKAAGHDRYRKWDKRGGTGATTVKGGMTGNVRCADCGKWRFSPDPCRCAGKPSVTDAARTWSGFGTALKPAHEPIVVARKPLTGTVAANVERYGTGALNIDGTRVTGGRWPANVAHDGSVEVLELFPQERDASAARFFYCAKASRADREAGLVGLPTRRLADHSFAQNTRVCHTCGTRAKEPGPHGRWPDCDHDDWSWVPLLDEAHKGGTRANDHPTVKPHDLMRWLVRLVGGQRGSLILDPFAGSGSTLRAARAEGFDFLGIERDPHYYRLACLRAGLPDPGEVAA